MKRTKEGKRGINERIRNFKKIKFVIFLIFITFALTSVFFAGKLGYNIENIQELLLEYYYTSILIYIILISIASATTLPISIIAIPGILVFSFWSAVLYAFVGILLGAMFVFFISRYFGKSFIKEYVELKGGRLKKLNEIVEERSFKMIILLNFVYFFPSNLAHMVAGLTKTPFHKFLFATSAGNFANFLAVVILVQGIVYLNYYYIFSSILILILTTLLPLYFYRKHVRDIIILAYSEETYKKLKKAKREFKEERRALGV